MRLIVFTIVSSLFIMPVHVEAAGRTYKSAQDDDPRNPPLETCRLKRLSRSPDGNVCIYKRQSGGPDVNVMIDERVDCLQTFQCKQDR